MKRKRKFEAALRDCIERTEALLEQSDAIAEDFPCRDDVIAYVRQSVVALRNAEGSWTW